MFRPPDPTGIAIHQNAINPFNGKLLVADRSGYVLRLRVTLLGSLEKLGTPGHGKGEFSRPNGVAVDVRNGNIFVSNTGNNRIEKLSASGSQILAGKPGSAGTGQAEFNLPTAITLDPTKRDIFVSDTGNSRIQKLTNEGKFILELNGIWSMGIAVDLHRNVYISDTNNHKIQKRTSDLQQVITVWRQYGSGNGEFNQPYGIAVDFKNDVFVADRLNHRVQRFSSDGTHINNLVTGGPGNAEFRSPFGVAIDDNTNSVYVSDDGYNSIQVFTKSGSFIKKRIL
jgi:DNA-binding beta-propeller fold protein YncE